MSRMEEVQKALIAMDIAIDDLIIKEKKLPGPIISKRSASPQPTRCASPKWCDKAKRPFSPFDRPRWRY
jgi:hypothetical protein